MKTTIGYTLLMLLTCQENYWLKCLINTAILWELPLKYSQPGGLTQMINTFKSIRWRRNQKPVELLMSQCKKTSENLQNKF
jgi:hypothetical protein